MANRRYNTQTRKKFDNGSEKPKSKDMMDRNPNRTMSPETKKKVRLAIERSNKQKEARSKKPTRGKPKDKKMERRTKAIEPLRKPSEKQQRELRRFKEEQKPMKTKVKDKINKVKDKVSKVGNMKVKDAAKAIGTAALAGTPVGLAKKAADTVNKNFKFQSPIVRKNRKFGGR